MKRFAALALILLLCLLSACSDLAIPEAAEPPSTSHSSAPTGSAASAATLTPLPTRNPTPSLTPQPTAVYDTDIPEVVIIDDEPAINSGYDLYEDGEYIYTTSPWYYETPESVIAHKDLYRISKTDDSATRIAQDVGCFTLSDGKVYYVTGEAGVYQMLNDTVYSYDTATEKTLRIFHGKDHLYSIAVYEGRIYFTADPHPELEYEFYSDLFSRNLDGSDRELVVEEPSSFCIYCGSIYYMSGGYGDGTPFFQCALNGSDTHEIVEWASGAWRFEICSGKLLFSCFTDESSNVTALIVQSLKTGAQTVYPGYTDFALLGQYVVTPDEDTLDAIDIRTGQTYHLAATEDIPSGYLYSGDGCVYISEEGENGSFALYRLTIENGCTNITFVAQVGGRL